MSIYMHNIRKKILVLSRWFPRPQDPILGCFVAEQVKALIEYEFLDVRVVCFVPFWMRYRNYFPIFNRNKTYRESLKLSLHWDDWNGIKVMYIPYRAGAFIKFPLQFYSSLIALSQSDELIWKDFEFDLVHAHTSYIDGRLGVYLSQKYKVPLIITEHTGPFSVLTNNPLVRWHTTTAINSANRLICVSNSLAKQVSSAIKCKIDKIQVIHNGYNTNLFYPDVSCCHADKIIRLLFVGSLDSGKNPFLLVKAFEIIKSKISGIKLTLVGDGKLFYEIKKYIQSKNLESHIFVLGRQSREKVSQLMRCECDIFILPSNGETFGCVVVEALASGKPVVSTQCGGPEDIIKHDFLGELCPTQNIEALASSILKVINQLSYYDQNSISNYALENFSYKVIAQQVNSIYQSV